MKPVIVTTEHRGIFFGYLDSQNGKESLVLKNCRCAIYWSGRKGFLGLASDGPEPESRIGARAESVTLYDITSIADCSDKAVKVWEEWK